MINSWYFASDGSLAYKQSLWILGWWLTKLSNAFDFPNPEPQIINMDDQEFVDNLLVFFYVFFCNIIKVNHFQKKTLYLKIFYEWDIPPMSIYVVILSSSWFLYHFFVRIKHSNSIASDNVNFMIMASKAHLFFCYWCIY